MKPIKETGTGISDGGNTLISVSFPYQVEVELVGDAPLLFHSWNNQAVQEKAAAKKGSAQKKMDDLESYVRRMEDGSIGFPNEYLRAAIVTAAKFQQDPRSPRKSASDLFKASIVMMDDLTPINGGVEEWDYVDYRRVVIQRAGVTRARPAFKKGWKVTCQLLILTPEYIDTATLRQTIEMAGKLVGVGDFRPTFGRFGITLFRTIG